MKKYDIYVKDKCLFYSVNEKEFNTTWETLTKMVGIVKTDYSIKDLYYQEFFD